MFTDLQLQGVGAAGTGQIISWLIAEIWIWSQIGDNEDMDRNDFSGKADAGSAPNAGTQKKPARPKRASGLS